jgi:hypothetical protein
MPAQVRTERTGALAGKDEFGVFHPEDLRGAADHA